MTEAQHTDSSHRSGTHAPPSLSTGRAVAGQALVADSEDTSFIYSVLVAQGLFADFNLRYARLFEDLELETGACRRRVQVLWRLPTTQDVSGTVHTIPTPTRVVVPLTIMRRGQMYTHLKLKAERDIGIRILSHRSATRLTRTMLDLKWSDVVDELVNAGLTADTVARLDARVAQLITDVVDGLPRQARRAVSQIEDWYRATVEGHLQAQTGAPTTISDDSYSQFVRLAHRLGRRQIIWVELTKCTPGDVVQIEYSYFTRFTDEHRQDPKSRGLITRMYEAWKRWVGQPPSSITIPISRHALTHSYHVTYPAPEYCFLDKFDFVDLLPGGASAESFADRARTHDAKINGDEDLGGAVGHLYCHDMPVGPRSAVQVKLMERPPGATASVAWLCLVSLLITIALLFNWDSIFQPEPPRILQVALPIPGITAIWFAHVFHIDSRRRLPVAARLGLYATVSMSAFLLVLLMFAAGSADGKSPLPMWNVIAIAAVIQGGTTCYSWYQRVHFYRNYQAHQAATAAKYGL